MTYHATQRLLERVKPYHLALADQLMNRAQYVKNAAIVTRASDSTVKCNDGSNGQYLVLIVRNGSAVTFMYSRHNQVNCEHLRVPDIINL